MSIAFVNREPTPNEMTKLRLILSTYQDGTGQLAIKGSKATLPGWRDLERSVALTLNGEAQESKAIFDVLIPDPDRTGVYYGIACKMRRMLTDVKRTGRVTIEVSNSAGRFWNAIKAQGLDETSYEDHPAQVGKVLIDTINGWHQNVSIKRGGNIDLDGSSYLVLQWSKALNYQLYHFGLEFPPAETLRWQVEGRRLMGLDNHGTLFEWYGFAGGQLKYYPFARVAKWASDMFRLEPLPPIDTGFGILRKAAEYFPELWKKVS